MGEEFFRLMTDKKVEDADAEPKRRGRTAVQCSCGRFAKYLDTRHWYNGNYNCETMNVRCSRCGDVGIELV